MLLLALTGVLWGSIGLVARLLQDRGQPAVTITFWRFACASVLLGPCWDARDCGRWPATHADRPGSSP